MPLVPSSMADQRELVLDASAVVDLVIDSPQAPAIRRALVDQVVHAPSHLHIEVASALGRLHRTHVVTRQRANRAHELFLAMPVRIHEVAPVASAAWARQGRLTMSDAFYVVLAEDLGLPLLTTDQRLARAVRVAATP